MGTYSKDGNIWHYHVAMRLDFRPAILFVSPKANCSRQIPEDLNGAPQVEHKKDNRPVLHFLQASKNDKQDHVPPCNLSISKADITDQKFCARKHYLSLGHFSSRVQIYVD